MRCWPTTLHALPLCLAGGLLGCGPSVAVAPDAGTSAPASPSAPVAPTPPRFACPDRYRVVELESAHVCDPWEGARPRCAAGELLRAGGCEPIAVDCGTDAPPETSAPGVVLVRPGSAGGDGSLERPFGTVAEALASGARTLALGPGEHAITGGISGATLIGTCSTLTTIRLEHTLPFSGVTTLRRLRVTGAGQLLVPIGAELVLDRVEIDGMSHPIELRGSLLAQRTSIHDNAGEAIGGFDATSIVLEDVALERIEGTAIFLDAVTTQRAVVSLVGVVLADVGAGTSREAISIDGAATLNVERVVIEDAPDHGLIARATTMTVADVVLRRLGGAALFLEQGRSEIDRVWVHDAEAGLTLGPGQHHARDLVIADTVQIALATLNAEGDATRVDVRRAGTTGVSITGGAFAVRDLRVSDVLAHPDHDDTGGAFLVEADERDVELGVRTVATLERAWLEGSEHFGLGVSGATLHAADVEVGPVYPRSGTDGYGVFSMDGGELTLARASIHDVSKVALLVQDASATVEDVSIAHVSAPDELDGVGITVLGASAATISRAEVADTVRWGVIVSGVEASLVASDLDVHDVHVAPCGSTFCGGVQGGAGIVAHDGASVSVSDFWSHDCEMAGVIATAAVTVDLSSGVIERSPIGLITSPTLPVNRPGEGGLSLRDMQIDGTSAAQDEIDVGVVPPTITL